MAKTNKNELTQKLEEAIRRATYKVGTFRCMEVKIGFDYDNAYGRVDYLTIDTKNIIRCYEVKSSVSDFRSKAKWTFVGHYNYFVLDSDTWEKVKGEVPNHVGVYVFGTCVKKPKKQQVSDEMINLVQMSMIRSLSRDSDKLYKTKNPRIIEQYETRITNLQNENYNLQGEVSRLRTEKGYRY